MSDTHEALFRAVGSILQRGTYGIDEVDALRAAAADKVDIGNCRLAGQTLAWLMQQSGNRVIRRSDADQLN